MWKSKRRKLSAQKTHLKTGQYKKGNFLDKNMQFCKSDIEFNFSRTNSHRSFKCDIIYYPLDKVNVTVKYHFDGKDKKEPLIVKTEIQNKGNFFAVFDHSFLYIYFGLNI